MRGYESYSFFTDLSFYIIIKDFLEAKGWNEIYKLAKCGIISQQNLADAIVLYAGKIRENQK